MRKIIQTAQCLILLPALLFALAVPCVAAQAPVSHLVSTMEELLARYPGAEDPATAHTYFGMQPLLCSSDMVLGPTKGEVKLMAMQGLWVRGTAVLTLDNPNLVVIGPPPFIIVEPGATLRILRWSPWMIGEEAYTHGVIRVEEGGILQVADGVELPGDMVEYVRTPPDSNAPLTPEPEPEPPPEPNPEPEPEPNPPPEVQPEPITNLWGEVRKVMNGKLTYTMTLPRLSMDEVGSITIARSTDGVDWAVRDTFVWDEERAYFTAGMDSDSAIQFGEKNTYITYVEETDYRDFYLRLTLEGSRHAGVTNVVKVSVPAGAGPGESVKPPAAGNYEDSGGNQGGGGQGESDRTGQQTPKPTPEPTPGDIPTPTPTPAEIPSEDHGSGDEAPDNLLPETPGGESADFGSQQPATGAQYSGISAFYPTGGAGTGAEPAPLPARAPAETDAPQTEDEEKPNETKSAAETKPDQAVTEEQLAVPQEIEPAVPKDGDRIGQAALMTLALGGGVAAVSAITLRIKSRKRRL